jgi:hypothetical protein
MPDLFAGSLTSQPQSHFKMLGAGLAAGQLPSLPTTFTHTDYRVTVEIAEDLNAETENAVEVKLISPRGSGTSSVSLSFATRPRKLTLRASSP